MNWRRGLFRLWVVGTALFVLAVAFVSYGEIKQQFDADAEPKTLATNADLADWVYRRFYSDMPRQQFDKKITARQPITEPEVIEQLETTIAKIDTSRPYDEWTNDELRAYILYGIVEPNNHIRGPTLWATFWRWAIIRASML